MKTLLESAPCRPEWFLNQLTRSGVSSATLLESSSWQGGAGTFSYLCAEPIERLVLHRQHLSHFRGDQLILKQIDPEAEVFFERLHSRLHALTPECPETESDQAVFHHGWLGYFGYDFARCFWPERRVGKLSDWPEASFGLFSWVLIFDHVNQRVTFSGTEHDWNQWKSIFESISRPTILTSPLELEPFTSKQSKSEYIDTIHAIRRQIAEGDYYQINYTQKWSSATRSSPEAVYQVLRHVNPVPYAAYLPLSASQVILSASPELFFSKRGSQVSIHPIKGTIARHSDEKKDLDAKKQLLSSQKDRAELMMIVDLERNDLGRISLAGSVQVPSLIRVESFQHVHHLVSTVQGRLQPETSFKSLISSLFPCGSITGAPKLRAMERIAQWETYARGPYTGSIGWIGPDGNAQFNVAIRTLLYHDGELALSVGGGIVYDSEAETEYQEAMQKGKAFFERLRQWQ